MSKNTKKRSASLSEFFTSYKAMRKMQFNNTVKSAKLHYRCYLFLLPYFVLFITFFILPMFTSMWFGFTDYNILEKADFVGLRNYINLILQDDIFLTSVKNTMVIAIITGPVGYILSFGFAWFINELPRWVRTIAVVIFYAPSIAGNIFVIFTTFFRGDAYGYVNSWLIKLGLINTPILFFLNPQYMLPTCIGIILWMSLGTGFLSFVAGFQGLDQSLYESGYVDGIRNRWQELWYITLPGMRPMLMFGAVLAITGAFGVCDVTMALCGYPSVDYAARTIVTHLFDYGYTRFEMGYASAIATILFFTMILCNKVIQSALRKVGRS